MAQQKVLVVDDESAIRDMLRMALELSGYECLEAENIFDGHRLVLEQGPDIVLLDWMLPGGNGTELLRRLKQSQVTQDIPVIMVTAKTTEDNIIQGLDVGADDYITKPFAPRELIARIKALLRRAKPREAEETIEVAGLRLDLAARRGFINGEPLDLGPTEFKLLHFFMSHPDRAYTRGRFSITSGVPTSTLRSGPLMSISVACGNLCRFLMVTTVNSYRRYAARATGSQSMGELPNG